MCPHVGRESGRERVECDTLNTIREQWVLGDAVDALMTEHVFHHLDADRTEQRKALASVTQNAVSRSEIAAWWAHAAGCMWIMSRGGVWEGTMLRNTYITQLCSARGHVACQVLIGSEHTCTQEHTGESARKGWACGRRRRRR